MLNAYFVDPIVLVAAPNPAQDKWGEPLPVTLVSFKGYIDRKTRLIRNFAGEQVVSSALVLTPHDLTIIHEDKLRFDGEDHAILNIAEQKHFSKTHYEVFCA